jgi:hypothetical protein
MPTATPAPRRSARLAARAAPAPRRSARLAAAATRVAPTAVSPSPSPRRSAPAPCPYWWDEVGHTAVEPCDYEPPTTNHHKLTIRLEYTDGEVMLWCGHLPLTQENGRCWDFSTRTLQNPPSPTNDVKSAHLIAVVMVIV